MSVDNTGNMDEYRVNLAPIGAACYRQTRALGGENLTILYADTRLPSARRRIRRRRLAATTKVKGFGKTHDCGTHATKADSV